MQRVTDNPGKRTPGIDPVLWESPEKQAAARGTLRQQGSPAQPLRRVWMPQAHGQRRPLGMATMWDRAMPTVSLRALDPMADTTGERHSSGFRPARCTAEAIEPCRLLLSRTTSAQWLLEADMPSCCAAISHDGLVAHIPLETPILRQWLQAGCRTQGAWHPTDAGTPPGGPAAPVLGHLTWDGGETRRKREPLPTRQRHAGFINLVRWADDGLITGRTHEVLDQEVTPRVEGLLQERGLRLSAETTRSTPIAPGIDFLGHHSRKYRGKC